MVKILLAPYQKKYAKELSALISAPQVKDGLGLNNEQISVEFVSEAIDYIIDEENLGRQYSRVVLNEDKELIGFTMLRNRKNMSYIDTWSGFQYWGKGYYQLAVAETLYTAFTELNLKRIFAFAKLSNKFLIEEQKKLPYIRIGVEKEFPQEHKKMESWMNAPCMLHIIEKDDFLEWYLKINN